MKFYNIEDFEEYVFNYLKHNKDTKGYVYFRYGYTADEMKHSQFEIEGCEINKYGWLSWHHDWFDWKNWDKELFVELKKITTYKKIKINWS